MRVNSAAGNQTEPTPFPRRSVYDADGTDRIGDVAQVEQDRFIARDRQGRILGTFDSMAAASVACWRVAHGQPIGAETK
jgi:hypothetical protein